MLDEKNQDELEQVEPEEQLDEDDRDHEEDDAGGGLDGEPDGDGCEDECEEPGAKKKRKKKGDQANTKAATPPATEKPAPTPAKQATPKSDGFLYPFLVRYAAEYVDLLGFTEGQRYTTPQVKKVLIDNGYTEFREMEIDLHHAEATNTLVITIRGSRKGSVGAVIRSLVERIAGPERKATLSPPRLITMMPATLLQMIETGFHNTFARWGTEDRVLVYVDESGNLGVASPTWARSRALVYGDVPLALEIDGRLWDLAFDLHSHHVMGAFWSGTDSQNERLRGPIFGVYSWKEGKPTWLFRRWCGPQVKFQSLTYTEVVIGDGGPVQYLEAGLHG